MFLAHTLAAGIWCLTVIGIPLGMASFKMIPISLRPLGREIVASDDVAAAVAAARPQAG